MTLPIQHIRTQRHGNDERQKLDKFPKTICQHCPAQGQKESQEKETAKDCPGTQAAANFGRARSVKSGRKATSFRCDADPPRKRRNKAKEIG